MTDKAVCSLPEDEHRHAGHLCVAANGSYDFIPNLLSTSPQACPTVPPALDALIGRMLAKQPEERLAEGEEPVAHAPRIVRELDTLSSKIAVCLPLAPEERDKQTNKHSKAANTPLERQEFP